MRPMFSTRMSNKPVVLGRVSVVGEQRYVVPMYVPSRKTLSIRDV